jgi:DnaJ-class molecular chaperone
VLLDHDADSYRVLGGSRRSTHEELRHNMALLMRWLHPDLQALRNRAAADREVFSSRVTRAWEDLKNDERRRAYDRLHPPAAPSNGATRRSSRGPKTGSVKISPANGASKGRYPGSAAKPMLRSRSRSPGRSRHSSGGSFWMRLFDLFRRSP